MPNNEAVNYEIALICAEAQEDFVKEVAESLLQFGVSDSELYYRTFLKDDARDESKGDTRDSFHSVFSQTHLTVLFVSKEFLGEEKMRTCSSDEGGRYVLPIILDDVFPSFVPDKLNSTKGNSLRSREMAKRILSIYRMTKIMDPETERYHFRKSIPTNFVPSMIEGGNEKNVFRAHSSAKTSYLSALSKLPIIVSRYFIRGDIRCLIGQHRSATRDYNRATRLELSKVQLNLSLAGTCKQLSQIHDMEKYCEDALRPELNLGYFYCAITEAKRKIDPKEKSTTETVPTIEFELARIFFTQLIGGAMWKRYDEHEIFSCFKKSLRQHPIDACLWYLSGLTKGQFRHCEDAVDDITTAIEIAPQQAYFFYTRGLLFLLMGRTQSALEDYNKAIQIDPRLARGML